MKTNNPPRSQVLERLEKETFDVAIIGGGVTGAGIALDASSRGLRVALIEMQDFAFGTSSRSTKLIHGGLRYLKQLEFALVKEVGSERAIVHQLAPHLVVPEKMLLPLYEKRGLGYWLASIGLKIYDWLAGVKPEDQRRMLTRFQTIKHEPLLKPHDIRGGAIYAEYRTDDARLTIELIKKAARNGAVVANYVHAMGFVYEGEKVSGVISRDGITGQESRVLASCVVNATGPWVDELRTMNSSRKGKFLHLTKGVHLVVPYHRLPVRQAIYFDVPDGRMIFAIPRGRITYVGTTDTDYHGDKENVCATQDDVRYLLDATNATFPSVGLTPADVESSWAGLRPLIHEEGKSASELSRKDEIFQSDSGLISIAGGKLTGYRKMAERVVDLLIREHFEDRDLSPCSTHKTKLAGALNNYEEVTALRSRLAVDYQKLGLKGDDIAYLIHLYGAQATEILTLVERQRAQDPEIKLALAQLEFSVQNEMIVRAVDFFVRRTGMLFFDLPRLRMVQEVIFPELASHLGWNEARRREEEELLHAAMQQALHFRE